jgi:glucose uptake protein GlcU
MASPETVGYICCVIAGVFFGSNYIPVKKYECGDGVYFQWVLCSAIWFTGFVVNGIRNFPPFQPLAMLGGVLWCTGNMLTVPIIRLIGMGKGQVLWSDISLFMGWASGAFGILGVTQQDRGIFWLSILGTLLAIASAVIFSFIKPDGLNKELRVNEIVTDHHYKELEPKRIKEDIFSGFSQIQQQIIGFILCVIAGMFYGLNFNPPIHIMDTCSTCSKNGLDYVFSHFTGIYLTSTLYFLIYCLVQKNQPKFYPEATFPGFISGVMWGTAQICWFIANSSLSMVQSFPIVSILPSVVSFFWGIVIFKEFSGRNNYILLGVAYFVTALSIICTVLSNYLAPKS